MVAQFPSFCLWTIIEADLPHVLLVREAIGQTVVEWPEEQEATP
jgi:hypothetical protein